MVTLIVFVLGTGCAPKQAEQPITPDPALEKLSQAADSIQSDLEKLARIKQAGKDTAKVYSAPQSGPLTRKITLQWSGPLQGVLKAIAQKIGFSFQVQGQRPASPVLVTVDSTGEQAFQVLQDLGWKAGKHQVSVDGAKEIIQLTYRQDSLKAENDPE